MATIIPQFNKEIPICNLDTYNHTVITAGCVGLSARLFEMGPDASGLSVTIKVNGTTVATSAPCTPLQDFLYVDCHYNVNVNDTVTYVVASTNNADTIPNRLKGSLMLKLNIGQ